MSDNLRRAFATLDLRPDSSRAAVTRRYRVLVKRWHPDRFASDPQGVVEATQRLRAINVAHDTIEAHWPPAPDSEATADPDSRTDESPRASGAPPYSLTRDQIEDIVAAMRYRESLWERLLDEPWNRSLSLLLAIGYVTWGVRLRYVDPAEGRDAIVLSVVMSGWLLPFVWSDSRRRKVFGWFWLVFFAVLLPAFSAWMDVLWAL
jgi:curved DNA-binding protein CbpA